jgi:site-specific DNA recombinase
MRSVAATRPTRAAIYCRVSTDRQEQDGSSLDSQDTACHAYAEQQGYRVAVSYRETFSGGDFHERPRLSELRAAIRAGEIDVVIAYAVDRVSRTQTHIWILLDELERAKARLEIVSEPLDQTPTGKFILSARAFAAEVERQKVRERTSRAVRSRAASGLLYGMGSDLYGYTRVPGENRREIAPAEAAVVRAIFERYAAGEAARALCARLNGDGVPSPGARRAYKSGRVPRWASSAIYRVLTDPAYRGETYAMRFDGRAKLRPRDEWIALPAGITPAIVSAELWEAAQARLATDEGADTRNKARPYLLRARVVCGVCGLKMHPSAESKGRRAYRCQSRDTATGACGSSRVPADDVERWAWDEVKAVLRDPSIIARERERALARGEDPGLTSALDVARRRLAKVEQGQARLMERFRRSDDFPWEIVEREVGRAEVERKQLAAEIVDLEARITTCQQSARQWEAIEAYCQHVAGKLDSLDFDGRRLALEALAARITANGREWEIRGGIPTGDGVGVLPATATTSGRQPSSPPWRPKRAWSAWG